jgi:2,5-furandicarboxylate decarboxylase 1
MNKQDLRSFVDAYRNAYPNDVLHVKQQISLDRDVQAILLELERRRQYPIIIFENVVGSDIPIICNVYGSRRGFAFALGVNESEMPGEYAKRLNDFIEPVLVEDPPFKQQVLIGKDADLNKLPIPFFYPGDVAPYVTAGLLVAKDPDTGVETAGYHRLQYKAPDKFGVSLHSRRRMFEYHRRAEAKGQSLECSIAIGLHPILGMSALSYPPSDISKWQVAGGLFREPLEVASCSTNDLKVPAWAEIVIEGEILPEVHEPEGPFGEFTGYFSRRSTKNVFKVNAINMREKPWFQAIGSGRVPDHILPLGILREAEVRKAVSRVIPNVKAVNIPMSGAGAFTAYVSMKQTRPGEARHAIPIVLGVDHYIKLVVIMDDDIDVFDESDVLWAIATRVQADKDLIIIPDSMGAILDPSATQQGITAKMGIDATRPFGEEFGEKLLMSPEKEAWAREFVNRLGT